MHRVTYWGPHAAAELPGVAPLLDDDGKAVDSVRRGQTVQVPKDVADQLKASGDWGTPASKDPLKGAATPDAPDPVEFQPDPTTDPSSEGNE